MNINRTDANNTPKLKLYENAKKDVADKIADKNKAAAQKAENPDKITISSQAKNLSIIDFAKSIVKSELQRDLAEMNLERINALKEQVKNGAYFINTDAVVTSLISGGNV